MSELRDKAATDICQACGACCAYSENWPRFTIEEDEVLDLIPPELVNDRLSGMRCDNDRCSALQGKILRITPDLALRPNDKLSENGRYSFNPMADGMLRLDTRTGQVSRCSRSDAGWACNVALVCSCIARIIVRSIRKADQFVFKVLYGFRFERSLRYETGNGPAERRRRTLEAAAEALPPAFALRAVTVIHAAHVIAVSA